MNKCKKLPAYTLNELLIVLVIIGILILLALPNLMPLISDTRSKEAQMQLNHLYTVQRSHFMLKARYSTDFEDIGFEHQKTVDEGGNAQYKIEIIEATNTTFKARATALSDFNANGRFNVWEIDQDKNLVEVTKD